MANRIKVFLIINVKFLQNYSNVSLEMGKEIFDMRHNTDWRLTPELHKEENKITCQQFWQKPKVEFADDGVTIRQSDNSDNPKDK